MASKSPFARLKSFVADLLLWSFFVAGLATSMGGAGAFLDGTEKTAATLAGVTVSLVTGSRIAKKPKIKAFLSTRPVLWFLFLFNGGVAAFSYLTVDGAKGIATAVGMGLVSLGAAGGLVSGYRGGASHEEQDNVIPFQQPGYDDQYQQTAYSAPLHQPPYDAPYPSAYRPADDTHWA
ncbi:hypothetical protein ACIPX0_41720 [Streptomyces sp. NPDC090075]|uniref:hypothetical protein n=1 Tax=Streptomyces sp. NPDC090075 TaxID=3365937 RepID=UPI0038102CBC